MRARSLLILAVLALGLQARPLAHEVPNEVTVLAFLKPEGQTLRFLVRAPMKSLRDISFPLKGDGYLDIATADPALRDAATLWISDFVDLYENGEKLPKPTVGAVKAGFPFALEITREVVRIDFPVKSTAIEDALRTSCRVEVPGIYFDFDRATLKPESRPALMAIADMMKREPQWQIAIEGHTDNVGSDAYNNDLSTRRAATVLSALTRDYAIAANRLTSAGFGERRPVETNDTIAGRARNRRVELVRDCSKRLE